jgi:pseudaminic acid cytidylyltransferase
MSLLVYIPARGGSKRIPMKNIRLFCGVPALAHVIAIVNKIRPQPIVVVSTDNEHIANVAREREATVFYRDGCLSDDVTDLLTVVKADLDRLQSDFPGTSEIACVLPTAVLMSVEDLIDAVSLVRNDEDRFIVSVGRFRYPIQRALRADENGHVEMLSPSNYLVRSQDLERHFHDAGQFYVGNSSAWRTRKTMFDPTPLGKVVEDWRVHDIDVEEDWIHAELIWRARI